MNTKKATGLLVGLVVGLLFSSVPARAHCDAVDGPVVLAAKAALVKGDVTPVLKWVRAQDEPEVIAAFESTTQVRSLGSAAKELAERYFFETLVRVHRAGEGAPYTGLKPAGHVEPAVEMADVALESESVDALVNAVTGHIRAGIEERFERVVAAKKSAESSVDAGREYVAAYVAFIHYVDGLHQAASKSGHHSEHKN